MMWDLLSDWENAHLNRCPHLYARAGGASPDSTEGSGHGGCYAVFSFVILLKTEESEGTAGTPRCHAEGRARSTLRLRAGTEA